MMAFLMPVARFAQRHAVLVVLGWVVAAGVSNMVVPQLEKVVASHSPSLMPAGASSVVAADRSAALFGSTSSNNLVYVVLERGEPLQPADRQYYDKLVAALRSDTEHVGSVTDLWASPLSASAVQSQDGHAVNLMLRLSGLLGTTAAGESVAAVRHTVARLGPPAGCTSTSPDPAPRWLTSSPQSPTKCWPLPPRRW